jgi:chorismate dehydratase
MLAKERGRREPLPVIREAIRQLGGDVPFWTRYFGGLDYDFRAKHREGLQTYFDHAYELGILSARVEIQVLDLPLELEHA